MTPGRAGTPPRGRSLRQFHRGGNTNQGKATAGLAAGRAAELARRAVRGCVPGSFAVTMATGIVSAALLLAGSRVLADALTGIAAASFAALVLASLARAAFCRAALRANLADPAQAFSAFAFVAACDVLGSDLASAGRRGVAEALTVTALIAWIVLTWLVPGRLTARARSFPLKDVGGNWYLWVVGTQSLVITLTSLGLGGQAGRTLALAAWILGLILYGAVTVLVLARLRSAGLSRSEPTAPYWVSMGAASISVLAAAELLGSAWVPSGSARTAMTWVTAGLWALASALIVPLAARSAWRHLGWREPLRYRLDLWMIIFPCGMYATASMRLGASAGLPVLGAIGRVAAWPAAVGWALVFSSLVFASLVPVRRPTRVGDHE